MDPRDPRETHALGRAPAAEQSVEGWGAGGEALSVIDGAVVAKEASALPGT